MDRVRMGRHIDQLVKRREKIAATLKHIHREQAEAEQETDWLDRAAYESRIALLDRLNAWYTREMAAITDAFGRVEQDTYGSCLACHKPIEAHRLDCFPEAVFCGGCQSVRERLATT